MSERLGSNELAKKVACRPNQRSTMVRWLEERYRKFDTDRNGLPIVMQAYRDMKLGISDEKNVKYADATNLQAFGQRSDRH